MLFIRNELKHDAQGQVVAHEADYSNSSVARRASGGVFPSWTGLEPLECNLANGKFVYKYATYREWLPSFLALIANKYERICRGETLTQWENGAVVYNIADVAPCAGSQSGPR